MCLARVAGAQSTDVADYVVFGGQKVTIAPRAVVLDGHVGSNRTLTIASRAQLAALVDVVGDSVRVGGSRRRRG